MSPFGFDQAPEAAGGLFTEGVATIVRAAFVESQFGVQFALYVIPEDSDTENTLFYSMGNIKDQPRVVLDAGERIDGPNYRAGSKLDCLMIAWAKSGAPALKGNTASSFAGYTFEWEYVPMGDVSGRAVEINGKVAKVTVPKVYLGSVNAVDSVAMAEAITEVLKGGPKKIHQVVMGLPEGKMREAFATDGATTLAQLVTDGIVAKDGDLYSLVG